MDESFNPVSAYRQEALEHLALIEEAVLDMEQNPDNKECIDRLFRSIHTIKGSGAMFGFDDIAGFTHHVETILDYVRQGLVPVTDKLINLILASEDQIRVMVNESDRDEDVEIRCGLIEQLRSLIPDLEDKEDELDPVCEEIFAENKKKSLKSASAAEDNKTYRIRFRPESGIIKNGTEPLLLLDEIRNMGECLIIAQTEEIPPLNSMLPENCYFFWDIILNTSQDINAIKDIFIFIGEKNRVSITEIKSDISLDSDILIPRLGDILIERGDAWPEDVNAVLRHHQAHIGKSLIESGTVSPDKVDSAMKEQMAASSRRTRDAETSIRVSSEKLDRLINLVGELVITQAGISQISSIAGTYDNGQFNPLEMIDQLGYELSKPLETLKFMKNDISRISTVEQLKYDLTAPFETLEQLKNKLAVPFNTIERLKNEISTPVETLERLSRELRECVMEMRMLPIGIVFGKFRRLVRDLSAQLGKEIELITEGGDTELDKTVIERLNDPLVHIIRNCIDHGINMPDKREYYGKSRKGIIHLKAEHKGGHIVITIEDDGQGMDLEKIQKKAVENGLVQPDTELSEDEIFALVFIPGFSTVSKITSVSGRGVGMDVVKREIDSLGGTVRITGQKWKFTRIILTLPLTLAIIDGLLIRVGESFFVLPLSYVYECMELKTDKGSKRNLIFLRDKPVPFIRLREFFDIKDQAPKDERIVIVNTDQIQVGIVVDDIISNIQTVIKSLGRKYKNNESISGATIMGDGTVALIIDVHGLIRSAMK